MKVALALQFGPVELSATCLAHVRHVSRRPQFQLNDRIPGTESRKDRPDTLQPIRKQEEVKGPRCDRAQCGPTSNEEPPAQPFTQLFHLFPKLIRRKVKRIRTQFFPKSLQIAGQIITC